MIYVIKQIKKNISVIEYQDNLLEYLKKDGERQWEYDTDFWEWFKDKIAYNNEELSFIVVTDNNQFKIDNSINLTTKDQISTNQLLIDKALDIKGNNKIFFYPPLKSNTTKSSPKKPKKSNTKPIEKGSMADFFIAKTKDHKENR